MRTNLLDDGHNVGDDLLAGQRLSQRVEAEKSRHAVQVVLVLDELLHLRDDVLRRPGATELRRQLLDDLRRSFTNREH